MKTITKTLIASLTAVFLSSCNMGKHYANMRIDHHDEETVHVTLAINKQSEKSPAVTYTAETINTNVVGNTAPGPVSTAINQVPEKKPKLKSVGKGTGFKTVCSSSPLASKKPLVKKSKLKKIKRKPVASSAKYIDADEEKAKIILFIVLGIALAIMVGTGVFGPVGSVLLVILAGLAILCAAAIGLGLLIMGFLAMLGMNFFE
ncbi:MAG TPA: hypothetical protein VD905_13495 [Flavobacteriales bacterium]|nr:hypothetical protein [Flavobacteriales bacterium]